MEKLEYLWIEHLSLNKEDFANVPKGENPLVWGIRNGFIEEEAYLIWASSFYKIPAIKPDFFSLAVDFGLVEKFSKLYDWSEVCYPIYQWEDTLFVASLEPVEISDSQKICFLSSPFSEMTSAWKKHFSIQDVPVIEPPAQIEPMNIVIVDSSEDENLPELNFDFSTDEMIPTKPNIKSENEVLTTESKEESSGELNFSNLDTVAASTNTIEELSEQKNQADIGSLESSENETGFLLVEPVALPVKEGRPEENINNSQNKVTLEIEPKEENNPSLLNDDYTPLPFLTKQQHAQSGGRLPGLNNGEKIDLTITDHQQFFQIPPEKLISAQDLEDNKELHGELGQKAVISHIFYHLKKDYKRLMWAEFNQEGEYYPAFCLGNWNIQDIAWKTPIDITHPNIFKIAHNSKLPFHGEISDSPYNDKYYEMWLNNKKPSVATVFPICYDDICYGLIIGFSKAPEFDELGSLKKIENLVSICRNQFTRDEVLKAS